MAGKSTDTLWTEVKLTVLVFQNAAVLEILHVAVGIVKSNLMLTIFQVFSRVMVVCGILLATPTAPLSNGLPLALVAWSVTEVIRYLYYALNIVVMLGLCVDITVTSKSQLNSVYTGKKRRKFYTKHRYGRKISRERCRNQCRTVGHKNWRSVSAIKISIVNIAETSLSCSTNSRRLADRISPAHQFSSSERHWLDDGWKSRQFSGQLFTGTTLRTLDDRSDDSNCSNQIVQHALDPI
ncbi:hypothetical protein J6590_065132 [Homalodisca vitripennis]|nr:hypothetical protein J6590_065132 [Homalodisca vitripennis]